MKITDNNQRYEFLSCRHTSNVDSPGQGHIRFPNSTEKGTIMHQPGDPVVDDNLSQVFIVQNVRVDKGAWTEVRIIRIGFDLNTNFILYTYK